MRKESVDANVRFEMTRVRLIGEHVSAYKRRTWTPSGKDWVTEYGFEVLGFCFWLHLPDRIMNRFARTPPREEKR